MKDGIELETRSCQCGCGATFRVWPPSSPCWFKNKTHAHWALTKADPAREKARAFFRARFELACKHRYSPKVSFQDYISRDFGPNGVEPQFPSEEATDYRKDIEQNY